ncbi:g2537 [Coccomyxa viridis]|uniref:G2537 protein n=1 Tax=Coccomyxa viridis TaxID=1274662 RepID=A0ABP1FNK5_9CHLO
MGFVTTLSPCRVATTVSAPSKLDTVARWKCAKRKEKLRPRKSTPADRRHGPCTTHPELPPPPPAYTVLQAGSVSTGSSTQES